MIDISEEQLQNDFPLSCPKIKEISPSITHEMGDKSYAFADDKGIRRIYRTYRLGCHQHERKDLIKELYEWLVSMPDHGVTKVKWRILPEISMSDDGMKTKFYTRLFASDKDGNEVILKYMNPYDNLPLEMLNV